LDSKKEKYLSDARKPKVFPGKGRIAASETMEKNFARFAKRQRRKRTKKEATGRGAATLLVRRRDWSPVREQELGEMF
jgi:hypothetical protein